MEKLDLLADSVRLLSFVNGVIVVCCLHSESDWSIRVVLPVELSLEIDEDSIITAYDMSPYLENLCPFDVDMPDIVEFSRSSIMSVTVPSEHVIRHYFYKILIQKEISSTEITDEEEETSIH